MARGRFAILAVNLVVFLAVAEIAALAIFYAQHGGFFYTHRRPARAAAADRREPALTANALHPYFGPTHRPGHPFSLPPALQRPAAPAATNNFGFVSPHDYPYRRSGDDERIIGIFGGSVGLWFCQLGAERLADRLRRSGDFAGRRLTTLCFSHEGYKQPQQALVLLYFLSLGQELDLVINIDGFNEVALGRLNDQAGHDITMPSAMHLGPLVDLVNASALTPGKLAALARIHEDGTRLGQVAAWMDRNRLASVNFVLEQYERIVANRRLREQFRLAALPPTPPDRSLVYVTPPTRARGGDELYDAIARNWAAASAAMHALLAARSVRYVHVLQPNQYHTARRFAGEEARVALNDQSPFKEGVEKGYPRLLEMAAAPVWTGPGARFVDATGIFDREPSPVYVDDCCHYNARGNEILADAIAEAILGARP